MFVFLCHNQRRLRAPTAEQAAIARPIANATQAI
jgi:hypothetical protein